jgi:hypothetical protein
MVDHVSKWVPRDGILEELRRSHERMWEPLRRSPWGPLRAEAEKVADVRPVSEPFRVVPFEGGRSSDGESVAAASKRPQHIKADYVEWVPPSNNHVVAAILALGCCGTPESSLDRREQLVREYRQVLEILERPDQT